MGTLAYISPEVLQALPHDTKADMWALGVIAFELAHKNVLLLFSLPFIISSY